VSELHDFFSASVAAAAAFVGLLFVAVSIAPDKVFGPAAETRRRARAVGAFSAFSNIFFISLAALLPNGAVTAMTVVAIISLVQRARTTIEALRTPAAQRTWTDLGALSALLYLAELAASLGIAPLGSIADVTLVLFAYALGSSWALLGAGQQRA
jgi:hypothetical protein